MRPALLALAALPLAAAATPRPVLLKPCPQTTAQQAAMREPMRAHRLDEMGPARQVKGVYRTVDGCERPIVVRAEVGQPRR